MKRLFVSLLVAAGLFFAYAAAASAITIEATSAILIDAASGRVLYEQNAHESLPVASTTKVLTALLVLENVPDLTATVTLPADFVNAGESGIYLEPGDTLTYRDLLYALMLKSANDAAQALAIGTAGSEDDFVKMMNGRTAELGLKDSRWANAHGLDNAGHYSSAYDLAMITQEAMKTTLFNTLIDTDSYALPWYNSQGDGVVYRHNKFNDLYAGADGVKTGYTSLSGSCLIGSATRDGLRLIGVVLNSPDHYGEMATLMDYGFANYQAQQVAAAGEVVGSIHVLSAKEKTVDVVLGQDVSFAVAAGHAFTPEIMYDYPLTVEAPFTADQPIGDATYTDDDGNQISVPLYLSQDAERYTFAMVLRQIWQLFISVFL